MTDRWPWPGDSPLARARKVAVGYRTRLQTADPASCDELDAKVHDWGETWALPKLITVDDESVLTAAQAAEYLGVSMPAVRLLRLSGRLVGMRVGRGPWFYRGADLRELISAPRPRKRQVDQGLP
jgi:hypothetical protein